MIWKLNKNRSLREALNTRFFNRKKGNIKLQLIDCDYAPKDMEEQLPISCQLIRMIPGNDRSDYWLAKCKCPVKYGETIVNYLVLAPRFVGSKIEQGMGSIVINVAYVINESIIEDSTLNFDKCEYVAICHAIEC